MMLQEPKVEFITIKEQDMIATSDDPGQETHMCGGASYDPDPDECSKDPSEF